MKAVIICDSMVFKPLKKETQVELRVLGQVVGKFSAPPVSNGGELVIEGLSFEFKLTSEE